MARQSLNAEPVVPRSVKWNRGRITQKGAKTAENTSSPVMIAGIGCFPSSAPECGGGPSSHSWVPASVESKPPKGQATPIELEVGPFATGGYKGKIRHRCCAIGHWPNTGRARAEVQKIILGRPCMPVENRGPNRQSEIVSPPLPKPRSLTFLLPHKAPLPLIFRSPASSRE